MCRDSYKEEVSREENATTHFLLFLPRLLVSAAAFADAHADVAVVAAVLVSPHCIKRPVWAQQSRRPRAQLYLPREQTKCFIFREKTLLERANSRQVSERDLEVLVLRALRRPHVPIHRIPDPRATSSSQKHRGPAGGLQDCAALIQVPGLLGCASRHHVHNGASSPGGLDDARGHDPWRHSPVLLRDFRAPRDAQMGRALNSARSDEISRSSETSPHVSSRRTVSFAALGSLPFQGVRAHLGSGLLDYGWDKASRTARS